MYKTTRLLSSNTPPKLTVILIALEDYEKIRETMRHLRMQEDMAELEILVMTQRPVDEIGVATSDLDGFAGIAVIEMPDTNTTGEFRAEGVRQASAPLIVIGEDHSFPQAGWASAIVNGYDDDAVGAVGVCILNANPQRLRSWADLYFCWGSFVGPVESGMRSVLPPHNTSYRRDLLLEFGERLPYYLSSEHLLFPELMAKGHRLLLAAAAKTRHTNPDNWTEIFNLHYYGAKHFAGLRSEACSWPKRIVYLPLSWVRSAVKVLKVVRHIVRTGRTRQLIPKIIPPVCVIASLHAVGESMGYLVGVGDASARYAEIELRGVVTS